MLPTEAKNYPEIQRCCRRSAPEALLRNLNKLAAIGMTPELGDRDRHLQPTPDGERLRKDQLHPMRILIGMRQYAAGQGAWAPDPDAESADPARPWMKRSIFPSPRWSQPGKRFMLGLDVSGPWARRSRRAAVVQVVNCRSPIAKRRRLWG